MEKLKQNLKIYYLFFQLLIDQNKKNNLLNHSVLLFLLFYYFILIKFLDIYKVIHIFLELNFDPKIQNIDRRHNQILKLMNLKEYLLTLKILTHLLIY